MAYDQSGNTAYTFTWNGSVYCTFGGSIFGTGGSGLIGFHFTNWAIDKNSYNAVLNNCTANLRCPNGNQNAFCALTPNRQQLTVWGATECSYTYAWDLEVSFESQCFPIGKGGESFTAKNCN